MKQPAKTLTGKIIDKKTKKGLPELRIQAWVKNSPRRKLLGASITDKVGRFSIQLERALVPRLRQAKNPQVYFKIYEDHRLILITQPNGSAHGKPGDPFTLAIDLSISQRAERTPKAHLRPLWRDFLYEQQKNKRIKRSA